MDCSNWLIIGWLPATTTTILLSIIIWLSRNLIITRLTNAVRNEYDEKIEKLKAKLRLTEESFKTELRIKESQIDAIRNGALLGIANKQTFIYERQLEAVEQFWKAVISLQPAKDISEIMANIKFDVASKEAKNNPLAREAFKKLGIAFKIDDINTTEVLNAFKKRPFISPMAWALFSAYQAIVMNAVGRFQMIKEGLDKDIMDTELLEKLVNAALPHRSEYIKKYSSKTLHYLLEEIESSLLTELKRILKGEEFDSENLERTANILHAADELMKANEKTYTETS